MSHKEYMRKWRLANPERQKAIDQAYYWRHREEILTKRHQDRARIYKVASRRRLEIKAEVLSHYGGGRLACVACGFPNLEALTIDHIKGKGNEHRRELGHTCADTFYRWLIRNNFPLGYQTLCMNCQFIKRAQMLKLEAMKNELET